MFKFRPLFRRGCLRYFSTPSSPKISVPINREPEPSKRHKPGGYHPLEPGDLLNDRYRVFHQLGWGLYSTVWLVRDIKDKQLSAVKVQIGDLTTYEGPQDELSKLKILRDTNPNSPGHRHLSHLRDEFTIEGPNGAHICLVLDPMRRISKHVLTALQYVHAECRIVHTDIKGDNIMLASMPPESYKQSIDISIAELLTLPFALSDFGSAVKVEERSSELIQPVELRAPEVILKAVWDTKADIWNFGCLIYEFARGSKLFDPAWKNEETGLDFPQTHLAQIVGVLGQFPRSLLERGERARNYFNEDGHLLVGEGSYNNRLDSLLASSGHPLSEIPAFVDFLSKTLIIEPEERWSQPEF
ncbi:kinase-like protein [Gymnopilus junonius]|uniref:non-specific serine/threonine protein kinase n=1 Tax=Gymnopilus junonius TaxID=109634 RepID=A0A9P5N6F1_GYMJU|nr:kinase-like protein [Gymnopilus junonius]